MTTQRRSNYVHLVSIFLIVVVVLTECIENLKKTGNRNNAHYPNINMLYYNILTEL